MEQLTDEQLRYLVARYDRMVTCNQATGYEAQVATALHELQERRAADVPVVSIEARKLMDNGKHSTVVSMWDLEA